MVRRSPCLDVRCRGLARARSRLEERRMVDLKRYIRNIPDFPSPGILFRDISPLLREHLAETIVQIESLLEEEQWRRIDAIAGIESRGFILGSALALKRGKGFVLIRKQGKL